MNLREHPHSLGEGSPACRSESNGNRPRVSQPHNTTPQFSGRVVIGKNFRLFRYGHYRTAKYASSSESWWLDENGVSMTRFLHRITSLSKQQDRHCLSNKTGEHCTIKFRHYQIARRICRP
jgi:hypothetical protein